MVSPTLNVGLTIRMTPAMKSDTTSFKPRETATPPKPSNPQTAEKVTPSESRNTMSAGTNRALRTALVPVTSLGSRFLASVPPTASMAARSCDLARRVAASTMAHAPAVYAGHGSRHWWTKHPTLLYKRR